MSSPENSASVNPYAVSYVPYDETLEPQFDSSSEFGIYRSEKLLVVHASVVLPSRCIKTNEPTEIRVRRNFYWHHPAVFLLIIAGVLAYVIAAIVTRKQAVLDIPISLAQRGRWRRNLVILWMLVIASFAIMIGGVTMTDSNDETVGPAIIISCVSGVICFLSSLVFGTTACSLMTVKKIDGDWIWLRGAGPAFLNSFPTWQGK
ncbi:MAG: hypothetical protein U0892_19950 [Pirellulales bacterium]